MRRGAPHAQCHPSERFTLFSAQKERRANCGRPAPTSARCGDSTHSARTHNSQNGIVSAGARLCQHKVSAQGSPGSTGPIEMITRRGRRERQHKQRILHKVQRSGQLAADRHTDELGMQQRTSRHFNSRQSNPHA